MRSSVKVDDLIREYQSEVYVAAVNYFMWKNINRIAAENHDVLRALNDNGLAWNIIIHSLQMSFIITLGRIFDRDKRSFTLDRFIDGCIKNLEQFNRSALGERKIKLVGGSKPEWLDDYLSKAYQPTAKDFQALLKAAAPFRKMYEDRYEPIRNKIVAHNDFAAQAFRDDLYSQTNRTEVENMLGFLYAVGRVVEQLQVDGQLTTIESHAIREENYVLADLERLLGRLVAHAI